MVAPSARDLNALFAAALAFGADWRRSVGDVVAQRFPDQPHDVPDGLAVAVEESRSAIEAHIEEAHIRLAGSWTEPETRRTDAWIANRYPWMTRENRHRAISQGQYYAWHDHG